MTYDFSRRELVPKLNFIIARFSSSQKVIGNRPSLGRFLSAWLEVLVLVILGCSSKDVEKALSGVADLKHASHVSAAITVIGCAPDRAKPVIVEDLESFLAKLMGPENVVHIVHRQEFFDNLRPKCITSATW